MKSSTVFHINLHGFRQKYSTTQAIYEYVQKRQKYAVGVLLNTSKAYDRICYNTSFGKLYGSGIKLIN